MYILFSIARVLGFGLKYTQRQHWQFVKILVLNFKCSSLQGIFITKILPDGPARGVLEPGDKVLKVDTL